MEKSSLFYQVPVRYRRMENWHIVFWLLKDLSWCMVWKPLGLVMIVPTLLISCIILIRTRALMSEWCHNLAITCWITANSYWMISEFFSFDNSVLTGNITYKHLSMIPFVAGLVVLLYYYLLWRPTHRNLHETM
ncbi:MAG: hypothetical protein ACKO5C_02155 [Ferruginibacter sp.]